MNILLIGNGFDLAHGLPTRYTDFLEFCERVKRIYTLSCTVSVDVYSENNLDDWKMSNYIKSILKDAFEKRNCQSMLLDNRMDITVTTPNSELDELFRYIDHNTWLEYFWNCSSYLGENWIDFESEISRVIHAMDEAWHLVSSGQPITDVKKENSEILIAICKAANMSLRTSFGDVKSINNFIDCLQVELNILIRALEIYLLHFVAKIEGKLISPDIEKLTFDKVLSFNYTDTYMKWYDPNGFCEYDYIHGKANINSMIETNNMVLGIDEYLSEDKKDKEVRFIAFKKYYQRIQRGTGCKYREWIDEIHSNKIISNRNSASLGVDNSMVCQNSISKYHYLYIFGHSLDITDKDILRELILNDNVYTTIFYNIINGDNGRKSLGEKICNLVKVIGQDELIKRTGGNKKTIEFRLQQNMHEKNEY